MTPTPFRSTRSARSTVAASASALALTLGLGLAAMPAATAAGPSTGSLNLIGSTADGSVGGSSTLVGSLQGSSRGSSALTGSLPGSLAGSSDQEYGPLASSPAYPSNPEDPSGLAALDVPSVPLDPAKGNIVTFGDSVMANPSFLTGRLQQPAGAQSGNLPDDGRCLRGEIRYPAFLQDITGHKVEDFSCTGMAIYGGDTDEKTLDYQITQALDAGVLTPSTTAVFIQGGINDTWKGIGLPDDQTARYVSAIDNAVQRIRAAAPNAEITLLNYPDYVGPHGIGCWMHFDGVSDLPLPSIWARNALTKVTSWQQAAAANSGISTFDVEEATRGHDSCAPTEERWVAGIIDTKTSPYNINLHLTHRGNLEVAKALAATLDN